MSAKKYVGSKITINKGLMNKRTLNIVDSVESFLNENKEIKKEEIEIIEENIDLFKVAFLKITEYTTQKQLNQFRRNLLGSKGYSLNENALYTFNEVINKFEENYFVAIEGIGEIQTIEEFTNK